MSAHIVDSIFLALGLQVEDVERGLENMENKTKKVMASIAKNVIAPVLSFGALKSAIGKYTDQSFELGKMAKATDISMERLQAWRGAAADAGVEAGSFESAIYSVQQSMASAAVTGRNDFTDMLTRLSVGWMKAGGDIRNAEGIILDVSDRLSKLTNTQAIHVGSSLGFDRDAIQFLRLGRDELEKMLEAQKEFGMLTQDDAQAAADQRKELGRLGRSWDVLTGKLVRQFLPAVTFVVQGITKVTSYLQRHEALLSGIVLGIVVIMTARLIPTITKVIGLLKKLGVAFMFNPATSAVTTIVAGIALISMALDDLMTYAKGGESSDLLRPLWESFGTPEEVMKGLIEAGKMLKSVFTGLLPVVGLLTKLFLGWMGIFVGLKVANGVVAIFSKLGAAISFLIGVGSKFGVVLMFLGKALGVVLTVVRAVGVALMANPIGAIITAIAAAALLIITYWDEIKMYLGQFFSWLGTIWDATLGGIIKGVSWLTDKVKGFWDWLTGKDAAEVDVKINEETNKRTKEEHRRDPKMGRPGYETKPTFGKLDPEAMPREVLEMAYMVKAEQQAAKTGGPSPLVPAAATSLPPSAVNNAGATNITTEVNIDKIDVVTRATDAQGVATGIRGGLENKLNSAFVIPASRGVNNK